jgi:pumilio family protein 6
MADKSFHKVKAKKEKSSNHPSPSKKRKFGNKDKANASAASSSATVTPSNKKRALKAERQSHRKHATTVRSSKEIWNDLRVKTNDKATNSKLCTELHALLKGKCMEVAMQHDASRCVQGLLQFGTEEQRREVVMELCDAGSSSKSTDEKNNNNQSNMNLAELCKIQYAHFVVLKMIKYCAKDEVCVKLIVKVSLSIEPLVLTSLTPLFTLLCEILMTDAHADSNNSVHSRVSKSK